MKPYTQKENYTQINGHRVCYVDEGRGAPLLLVHGLGGSILDWDPVIEHFKRDHRVIALDLPGFGKSEFVDTDYSLELFAGAIRELLAGLGIEKTSIAGHSMGGLITLHLTLNHPELIENVVLVDPAGGHRFPGWLRLAVAKLPDGWLKKIIKFGISYVIRVGPLYRLLGVYVKNEYTKPLLEYSMAIPKRPDVENYMETYLKSARVAVGIDYSDRLGEICKQTLIVWGQKDLAVPLKSGQRINRKIRGSFLVAIPDAAHVVQLDQPELFNAAVSRFLAGAGAIDN